MKTTRYFFLTLLMVLAGMSAGAQRRNVLQMPDVSTQIGNAQLPVQIENTDEIVGVQFDLTLPVGVIANPVGTLANRCDGHTVTVSKLNSGVYRVILHSSQNRPLRGQSGVVMYLPITIPATFEEGSEHALSIANAVLGKATGENVLTEALAGKIRISKLPDLTVKSITCDKQILNPGDRITISWQVENIGEMATGGGWSEQVSLVSEEGTQSKLIATTHYDNVLNSSGIVSRQAEITLPFLLGIDGLARLQVRIVPDSNAGESASSQANNTQVSDNTLSINKMLSVELSPKRVDENAGTRIALRVNRSGQWSKAETFSITTTDDARVTVPSTIVIPANQSGAVIYFSITDNEVLDNDSLVGIAVAGNDYPEATSSLIIDDNEFPTLSVTASKSEVREGETFQLTVTTSRVSSQPLAVTLTSENARRFTFPQQVVIPTGETSATAEIVAVDNDEIELEESIAFRASADKYERGECIVILNDNDMPTLTFTLSPEAVSESDGYAALFGVIKRTDNLDKRVTLKLSDDSNGLLTYSNQTIVMAKNQAEVQFNIGVTDNELVDGNHTVNVTAAVYASSCDCSVTSDSKGSMSATLTIIDDDGPALKIKPDGTAMLEGSEGNVFAISHNIHSDADIVVRVTSDKDDMLEYDHELTISAGQSSANLLVNVKNNDQQDDSNIVTFKVEADGYAQGTCWILITDQTLPDATVSLFADKTEVEAEQTVLLRAVVKNVGNASLRSTTPVEISFSGRSEKVKLTVGKNVAVGDSTVIEYNYDLPAITGNHTFETTVNASGKVPELIYANNTSEKVGISVISPFSVTAQADKDVYLQDDSIHVTGTATGSAGKNARIEVYFINEGARQTVSVTSDDNGNYTAAWKPLSKQSGHFIVGACYPGSKATEEMDAFYVYGIRTKDNYKTCELSQTETVTGKIILSNPGNLAQSGLTITPKSDSENCEFTFNAPNAIGAGESVEIAYTVKANEITEGRDWQQMPIEITTAEGSHANYSIYYYVHSLKARLQANKTSINTTMTLGTPREYPVTIRNVGKAETGKITLALPNWIQAVTPSEMTSLAQGDSATILLRFIPTEAMKLNVRVSGQIGINCANGDGTAISFNLTPVSDEKGKLKVDVVDEYTFFTNEAPHVSKAKVRVKNPSTNEVVAEGETADDGTFSAELPEGYYSVTVDADKHDSYANTVIVDPGVEKEEEVFLSYQAITYSWDVEETGVEDEYEIETIVKYETRVPKPVVIITLPDEQPEPYSIIPVILTNKGLVNAVDVNLSLSISNGYTLEFLNDPSLEVLAPQQSHVFYAKMVPETGGEAPARAQRASSNSSRCFTLIARAKYKELCQKYTGEELAEQIKKWGTRHCLSSGSGGGGGGSYGGGGGYGPGHGPGYWGNGSYGSGYVIWDTDDPAKFCDKKPDNNDSNPDDSPDENDPVPPEEPEETDCDDEPVIEFIVADMSGKYSRKGLAADGESKVKIVLDGSKSKFPKEDCPEFIPKGWHLESEDGGTLEEGSSWKEAVYTAPREFSDSWEASKEVKTVFSYSYNGQDYTCEKSFALIRVPVVFVHGLNSSPANWNSMRRYLINSNSYTDLQLSMVDYSATHNDRYTINTPIVNEHISNRLTWLSKHSGYECACVDVVGHSMGGLLTKKVIQTYGSKGIRKLITINTPHGGSQLGNFMLDSRVQYVRSTLTGDWFDGYDNKIGRRLLNQVYNVFAPSRGDFSEGAVANLSVNCDAINSINIGSTSGVRCHAIVTNSNGHSDNRIYGFKEETIFRYIFEAFGYRSLEEGQRELFDGDDSDFIVPLPSQMGGLSVSQLWYLNGNGGVAHTSSCNNTTVQKHVLDVLKADAGSGIFANGFGQTPHLNFDMNNTLDRVRELYPPQNEVRTANNVKKVSKAPSINWDYKYIEDENVVQINVYNEKLNNIHIAAVLNDNIIDCVDGNEARISIPYNFDGDILLLCEGCDENNNYFFVNETITVDNRDVIHPVSICFENDSVVIINDEYITPIVNCTWDDGHVTVIEAPTYRVLDESIAYIDASKYIYGKKQGTTTVIASFNNLECEMPLLVRKYSTHDDNDDEDSDDSPSICSTVTLSFKQKNVMTRQAFRGTLTVNNGNETTAMKDVKMNLEVRDMDGNLTTSHEFQIDAESLNGFEGTPDFTSGWTLGGGETGVATILFIPTKYAAPTEPKDYSFGGSFSYTDPYTGLTVTRDLNPVTLTVNPSPNLEMTYFMQRDVFGDDPLTETVEPMIPSEFALIVNNKGYGDAENMSLTTHQPEIIDNQKGLAISFELISTQLNGGDKNLSLGGSMTSDFGTIPAHSQAYAQWWLQSSLLGHFIEYDVKATHLTSRNNPDLSLLDTVTVHELIHGFTVRTDGDKPLRGFLVNDIKDREDQPDEVYFTDATQQGTYIATSANIVKQSDTEYVLNVTAGSPGWNYGSLLDPTYGKQKLVKVTRADGTEVNVDNIWQTSCTLRDGKDPLYEKRLHFVGNMSADGETFYLTFEPKPELELEVESYTGVPEEGAVLKEQLTELTVKFNKPIKAESFTTEDITVNCQGAAQDASQIVIEQVNELQFKLILNEVTLGDGYYVLTVQTAGVEDAEGFTGSKGKQATWIQFVDGKVALTIRTEPAEGGTVSPATGRYDYGETITLHAVPAEGYYFVNWKDGSEVIGTDAEIDYHLVSPTTLTAVFGLQNYNVTIDYDESLGTIDGPATGIYPYGTQLQLIARPTEESQFVGWTVNDVQVSGEVLDLVVVRPTFIKAHFSELPVATLIGIVRSADSWLPIAGAVVTMTSGDIHYEAVTDDLGRYAIEVEDRTLTYELNCRAEGFMDGSPNDFWFDHAKETHNFTLQPGSTIYLPDGDGICTFSSVIGLDFSQSDVNAYYAKKYDSNYIVMEEVDEAIANEGLVLVGTPGRRVDIPMSETAADVRDNLLIGTAFAPYIVQDDDIYVLAKTTGDAKFHKAAQGLEIPRGKAFCRLYLPDGAKSVGIIWDEGTLVEMLRQSHGDGDRHYDLGGRLIPYSDKGVHVIEKKKMIKK